MRALFCLRGGQFKVFRSLALDYLLQMLELKPPQKLFATAVQNM